MYIEPNTIIKILKNVPLDNTYNHTIYFNNASDQTNYFAGLTKFTKDRQTYQRVQKGVMRIECNSESLYDCNYLMFQNTSFGRKWFYAFITGVEYVNDKVSQITFDIDVMQTWYFDYQLQQCFVEREHSKTDSIGDNIITESLDIGDYLQQGNSTRMFYDQPLSQISQPRIIVACSVDNNGNPVDGRLQDRVFTGVHYFSFQPTVDDESGGANAFLKQLTADNRLDSVVSVFMCPDFLVDSNTREKTKNLGCIIGDKISGYTPRNKKLFTFPYNVLYATAGDGRSCYYKFEFFTNPYDISFRKYYTMSCTPSCMIAPINYMKNVNRPANIGIGVDIDNTLSITDFPQCSYSIDSFKAWLSQNRYTLGMSAISSVAGAVTNPVGGLMGLANTTANIASASLLPPATRGSVNNSNSLYSHDMYDIYVSRKAITYDYAKTIDDYFTVYGYATKELKIPNTNVRKHWTYTKTNNCVIKGSVPSDEMNKICGIYNTGITFWVNGNEIGNYSLDNSPK